MTSIKEDPDGNYNLVNVSWRGNVYHVRFQNAFSRPIYFNPTDLTETRFVGTWADVVTDVLRLKPLTKDTLGATHNVKSLLPGPEREEYDDLVNRLRSFDRHWKRRARFLERVHLKVDAYIPSLKGREEEVGSSLLSLKQGLPQ